MLGNKITNNTWDVTSRLQSHFIGNDDEARNRELPEDSKSSAGLSDLCTVDVDVSNQRILMI